MRCNVSVAWGHFPPLTNGAKQRDRQVTVMAEYSLPVGLSADGNAHAAALWPLRRKTSQSLHRKSHCTVVCCVLHTVMFSVAHCNVEHCTLRAARLRAATFMRCASTMSVRGSARVGDCDSAANALSCAALSLIAAESTFACTRVSAES